MMTQRTYAVHLADPAQAEDVFVGLYGANLDLKVDARRRYRWYYLDSPAGPGRTFLLSCQAEDVGCTGLGTRTFYHRGFPLRGALLADFAVNREHRTGLPAITLQRAVRSHVLQHFQLAYGFPNSLAVKVFRRIGCHELGQMTRYVRVLRHGPYLGRKLRSPLAAWAAGAAIDRALLLWHRLGLSWAHRDHELLWMTGPEQVDHRFDDLWREARRDHLVIGDRGADFLRWRFFAKPGEHSEVAALRLRGSPRLRAYAVIQPEGRVAHLRDLLGSSEREIGALLAHLVQPLHERGYDSISMRFLGTPRLSALLRAHGYRPRERERTVIAEPGAGAPGDARTYLDPGNWYLTDADEDT